MISCASHRLTASVRVMLYVAAVAMMGGYMTCQAHRDPAYSHDPEQGNFFSNWMSFLPDDIPLSAISLPGTHNTMARFGGDIPTCQSKDLATQLRQGVRALDIRGRHYKNGFPIHHGRYYQDANLYFVLEKTIEFLKKNQKEAIFLLFQDDEYDAEGNTQDWTQTLDDHLLKDGIRQYIARVGDVGRNPELSQVRGKIFFVARDTDGYKDPSLFNIQDKAELTSNWDLYWKWEHVKGQMNAARLAVDKNTKYYVNYLSSSTGSFPYFVASGHSSPGTGAPRLATGYIHPPAGGSDVYPDFPRTTCFIWCTISFEGTNTLFRDRLKIEPGRTGIVFADFPGDELVQVITFQNPSKPINQALRTYHGTYLRTQPGLNRPLITQGAVGTEEKLLLVDLGNNRCLIMNADFKRVSARPGGTFGTVLGSDDYEVFTKEYIYDSTTVFALRTFFGTYVTAPPGTGVAAHHNTKQAKVWERFEVV